MTPQQQISLIVEHCANSNKRACLKDKMKYRIVRTFFLS
jgi:hypothetical protein